MKLASISIVIPCYNEELTIKKVIQDTFKYLPKYFYKYEVIVVNDGSTDATDKLLTNLSKKYLRLRIVSQKNKGYSSAMLAGIKKAKMKYVAYLPADGQFGVQDMEHCFKILPQNDLVLGYRGSRIDYSFKRLVYSTCYFLLLLILFKIKYTDIGWVNIWDTKKLQNIKLGSSSGIFILAEILIQFLKKGYKIQEAPSYYHPRINGVAKNTKPKVILHTLVDALKLWWKEKELI